MAAKIQNIAVIDDDSLIRTTLAELLKENGFGVHTFPDSATFQRKQGVNFDLFLIDLRLSHESGLDVMSKIRRSTNAPIMMLSGVGDAIDKTIGLEAGADDYMSKPFHPRELIARIRALLRRCGITEPVVSADHGTGNKDEVVRFGGFSIDLSHRILLDDAWAEVPLSNGEYRLLEYLVTNHDRVISRTELLNYLGSDLSQYVERTVDVMILRLRGKIELTPSKPVFLQTRRGKGYVFILTPTLNVPE